MGSASRGSMRSLQLATTNPITQHPSYNAQTRAADIAIIRLQNPILPSAEIAPIALPPIVTGGLVLPYENEEGFFTGFGVSVQGGQPANFIQRGYQRAIGNTRCTTFFNLNTLSAFCAEDEAERSNACDGDVGNPFVLNYRRQEVLVGLVSMHPRCKKKFNFDNILMIFFPFKAVKCPQLHTLVSHTTARGSKPNSSLKLLI